PDVKWIARHDWRSDEVPARKRPRRLILEEIGAWLDHFSTLEDVRIKVKAAAFDDADRARAKLKMFIIGRDRQGRREWLRARLHVEARRGDEGPWRLQAVQVDATGSMVARVDLFDEVAMPAGVAALFPPFGEKPNDGFIAHGAATADVNGDGLLDIAATGVDRNYLYLNRGDGTFSDAGASSMVSFTPAGSGALFLDFDNDGDPDLFLASVGPQILLENRFIPDGKVLFRDISDLARVDVPAVGFSAAAADVNKDGYPDIYVASYHHYGTVMPNSWYKATNGTPNLLFINQGDGTFLEQAARWGVDDARWTYAAAFADLDKDGDQDLYIANDFGENALYRNEGDRFTDVAAETGVTDAGFGMGVSFGDYDNDGDLDLHVTNMSSTAGARILERLYPDHPSDRAYLERLASGNNLFRNRGDGTFEDVTGSVGGLSAGWAFGGGFIDFDNDGWEDIYSPNGFISGKSMKDT
ncbi:MAG: FG-GAP repeat domain-containing protein, partial [Acidobacteriota bacterium]